MPGRCGLSGVWLVAVLAVSGAAAPAWSACPAGLPAEPAFHLPVEKLAPLASQLPDRMAKEPMPGRAANGVETRRLADVQLDPTAKYLFRVYTPLSAMPDRVLNAFVAAGELPTRAEIEGVKRRQVDCLDLEVLRLMSEAVANGRRLEAGLVPFSVIQAMRHFIHEVLTPEEMTTLFKRDLRRRGSEEIVGYLLVKSDKITFERLLEVSLNAIYLGQGAYGITAASMNYFGKPPGRLSLAEAAYLAALPKGPNNYHPVSKAKEAVERRNGIIDRMQAMGFIGEAEGNGARAEPLNASIQRAKVAP
jgi:hypothetical protein